MTYLADHDPESALAPLQAAASPYRIALGPRAGQKVLTLQRSPAKRYGPRSNAVSTSRALACMPRSAAPPIRGRNSNTSARYINRPAIANERLTRNGAGQVMLTLKTCYRDGTTHIVMSPLEFMQRLAALVPRPRLHLIRFHGVLAPYAKLRHAIISSAPVNATNTTEVHADAPHPSAPARIRWARLVKRVFEIDIEKCLHCGGTLKIIAAPSTGSGQASRPHRDRPDPHSPRLVRPGTAPATRPVIRSPRNGLTPNRHPLPSGSAPGANTPL